MLRSVLAETKNKSSIFTRIDELTGISPDDIAFVYNSDKNPLFTEKALKAVILNLKEKGFKYIFIITTGTLQRFSEYFDDVIKDQDIDKLKIADAVKKKEVQSTNRALASAIATVGELDKKGVIFNVSYWKPAVDYRDTPGKSAKNILQKAITCLENLGVNKNWLHEVKGVYQTDLKEMTHRAQLQNQMLFLDVSEIKKLLDLLRQSTNQILYEETHSIDKKSEYTSRPDTVHDEVTSSQTFITQMTSINLTSKNLMKEMVSGYANFIKVFQQRLDTDHTVKANYDSLVNHLLIERLNHICKDIPDKLTYMAEYKNQAIKHIKVSLLKEIFYFQTLINEAIMQYYANGEKYKIVLDSSLFESRIFEFIYHLNKEILTIEHTNTIMFINMREVDKQLNIIKQNQGVALRQNCRRFNHDKTHSKSFDQYLIDRQLEHKAHPDTVYVEVIPFESIVGHMREFDKNLSQPKFGKNGRKNHKSEQKTTNQHPNYTECAKIFRTRLESSSEDKVAYMTLVASVTKDRLRHAFENRPDRDSLIKKYLPLTTFCQDGYLSEEIPAFQMSINAAMSKYKNTDVAAKYFIVYPMECPEDEKKPSVGNLVFAFMHALNKKIPEFGKVFGFIDSTRIMRGPTLSPSLLAQKMPLRPEQDSVLSLEQLQATADESKSSGTSEQPSSTKVLIPMLLPPAIFRDSAAVLFADLSQDLQGTIGENIEQKHRF